MHAIAEGDGDAAARVVRQAGYAEQAPILGDIIFRAGVLSVDSGNSALFADAVAVMFTNGGAPVAIATDAFRIAGTLAATHGVTPEQGRVGAEAIAKTYAAYAV